MDDVAFPLGMIAVMLGGACLWGIIHGPAPKAMAYGVGLLGSCLLLGLVIVAAAAFP